MICNILYCILDIDVVEFAYIFVKRKDIGMGLEMIEAGWLSILPPLIAILLALKIKKCILPFLLA